MTKKSYSFCDVNTSLEEICLADLFMLLEKSILLHFFFNESHSNILHSVIVFNDGTLGLFKPLYIFVNNSCYYLFLLAVQHVYSSLRFVSFSSI